MTDHFIDNLSKAILIKEWTEAHTHLEGLVKQVCGDQTLNDIHDSHFHNIEELADKVVEKLTVDRDRLKGYLREVGRLIPTLGGGTCENDTPDAIVDALNRHLKELVEALPDHSEHLQRVYNQLHTAATVFLEGYISGIESGNLVKWNLEEEELIRALREALKDPMLQMLESIRKPLKTVTVDFECLSCDNLGLPNDPDRCVMCTRQVGEHAGWKPNSKMTSLGELKHE